MSTDTGQAVRIPSRLLMVEDEFFKAISYRQALNGLSMRIAQQEGLTGTALDKRVEELKNEPTEAMMAYARANAQYQTFTNPLGETGKAVMRFANTHPAFRLIMPFIRTPTNIVKFAGQRSPLAPLMADVRSSLMGKGPVEREVALARIMTGSAIIGATAYYASLGLITGGGPEDEKEKAALYRTGWQPYSVRIGEAYYAYNRLEPTGMLLGITADAVGIWDKAKQEEQDEMAAVITAGAISSIGNNLLSKTWLRGVSDAVQAINDPQRYGERWINNFAGTAIPSGVAQMARTQDPYLREVESIMDQIKSRVPGQRETLTPKLNLWGEPIKLTGGIGPDILSPVYTSFDKNDTVADEMIRLEVYPAMPQKKIRGIKLTPEQYNEYVEMAGAPAKQFLDQVMQTEEYGRMPDFMRRDLIEQVVKQTRNKAAVQMQIKYPEIPVGSVEEKVKEISQ